MNLCMFGKLKKPSSNPGDMAEPTSTRCFGSNANPSYGEFQPLRFWRFYSGSYYTQLYWLTSRFIFISPPRDGLARSCLPGKLESTADHPGESYDLKTPLEIIAIPVETILRRLGDRDGETGLWTHALRRPSELGAPLGDRALGYRARPTVTTRT
ncbi:hypothetical protein CPLU01_09971 [Colletotrichum plurivorum]|uniref:Uncharacterized protein n=1 Tax=Colletotrichum plurivorum TaxID=2175906 RepID=A0A8H6K7Y7_9PEZI|nr:hypothetical protein CPLU01_09971 [Colletotrichum plurivorum]